MSLLAALAATPGFSQNAGRSNISHQVDSRTGTSWQGKPGYRPVPRVRSSEIAPTTHHPERARGEAQRPGWNLQWRKSPQVARQQARQISDAAFEQSPAPVTTQAQTQPQAPAPKIVATAATRSSTPAMASTSQHVAPDSNPLRRFAPTEVRQVAWMNQQAEPSGGFSLPDNSFGDNPVTPPADAEVIPPGPSLQVPGPGDTGELPSPAQPSMRQPEPAPGQAANDLEQMFDDVPAPSENRPAAGAPSIGGMLQDEPAGPSGTKNPADERSLLPPSDPRENPDDTEDSPSDRDTFAPNPFGNRNEEATKEQQKEAARDARDRDRLRQGDAPSLFDSEGVGPTNSGTGLSCEDFRERIRVATIDQVSLDPSPPFRPDVIDEAEFKKLKTKFSEKQKSRTWRSIDGRPLGTGRLEDLAYEKAIIVTEFGSREELPLNRLSEADLAYVSQNWGLPTECLIEQVAFTPRNWTPTTMTYAASNLMHKPLYFEEVNLERYGHTAGPLAQPIVSSAHFFVNIAVLPYKMGVHSPHECQYALGYYRPGNCAPWIIPPVPLSVKGAWYQAAAMTGTALLVP